MSDTEDRLAVVDLLSAYTAGVDSRDWEAWHDLFTEEVTWDFESAGAGRPAAVPRGAVVDQVRGLFAHFTATHHAATSPRVTLDGDRARLQAHIKAEHWVDPELVAPRSNVWSVTGFYDDEAVRTELGWRLSSVRLVLHHMEGRHVVAAASALRDAAAAGAAD